MSEESNEVFFIWWYTCGDPQNVKEQSREFEIKWTNEFDKCLEILSCYTELYSAFGSTCSALVDFNFHNLTETRK